MILRKEPGQPENRPTTELALCICPDVLAQEAKALLDSCTGQEFSFHSQGLLSLPRAETTELFQATEAFEAMLELAERHI